MILLSDSEIELLTGYKRPSQQLEELHLQGFYRARIVRGKLILERAHYLSVCAGATCKTPQVRMMKTG